MITYFFSLLSKTNFKSINMKKLIYSMFALAALAMTNTSCQDELESAVNDANEVAVSFKVQLENAVGSRAVGDGTTAKELQYAVYKVDASGNTIGTNIAALNGETTVKSDLTAEVTFTLVKGQTYNFMFWAQKPGTPNDGNDDNAYYKLDKSTAKVEIDYKTNNDANDEGRDAFYAVEKSLKVTGPINKTITLKRPFAQINVGTSIGSLADAKKAEVDITRSKMTIKKAANKLDFFTGKVSATTSAEDVTYDIANIPELTEAPTDTEGGLKDVTVQAVTSDYEYLAMNYILVDDHEPVNGVETGAEKGLVNVEFSIYTANDATPINTFDVPNVPVQRNWRTNIIGDILNENVTFNVVIDPKFDTDENGEDHNYAITQELAYAAQNGGTVTLQDDVELPTTLTVKEGVNMVIDLNGHNIINTSNSTDLEKGDGIIVYGNLTINGEGTVQGNTRAVWARASTGAKVTINGGTYIGAVGSATEVIYASGDGVIDIYGGTFEAKTENTNSFASPQYAVLNLQGNGKTGCDINVYGGKFINFNPANNVSENPNAGYHNSNFVADGYKSVNVGTATATVYEVCVDVTVAAGATAELPGDGVILEKIAVTGGTLDGNGHTLTVADAPTSNYLIHATNETSIKHLTVAGENQYSTLLDDKGDKKSTRALMFEQIGDITVDDVHVSGVGYALNVNCSSTSPTHTLKVSNSTLVGWTSYGTAVKEATFTNVHFGVGNYFGEGNMWSGGIRPYANTTFENCTFDKDFYISFEGMSGSGSFTFKNCSVNGTKLEATNWQQLLKTEGYPATGVTVDFQ